MKDLLITIVLLLMVFGFDAISKLVARKVKSQAPSLSGEMSETDSAAHEDLQNAELDEVRLEKNPVFSPKTPEYFTYETIDSTSEDLTVKPKKVAVDETQTADIVEDNPYKLTFSDEEIYKGFIYSEIFNRKYK